MNFTTDNNYGWDTSNPDHLNEYGQPKNDQGYNLAGVAFGLGIASIVSTAFVPIIAPCILGSIAIILAILSKGAQDKMFAPAKRAVITAAIGISLNVATVAFALISAPTLFRNPSFRTQINTMSENMYGETFDEIVREIDDAYGIDLSGYLGIDAEIPNENNEIL